MGQKRKRGVGDGSLPSSTPASSTSPSENLSKLSLQSTAAAPSTSFQIVAGSYDRVLHGLRVTVPSSNDPSQTSFTPLFLFTAHASSIRCLAVSPPSDSSNPISSSSNKRILATSSPDTKINLYHLHTRTNLGTLTPPSASPTTSLVFPSKSTLISTDEAGYIHIFRTRDWSLLTSLHTPSPKPKNGMQPLGGINSLAVHPSGKLALTVSRNEKAVRMWNLMTGRKAGVLAFSRDVPRTITGVSGEGIKVMWRGKGDDGYAVMFERGVVLFGGDSVVKGKIVASPISKLCQVKFLNVDLGKGSEEICFVGTEDGRVLVFLIPSGDQELGSQKGGGPAEEDDEKGNEISPVLIDTIRPTGAAAAERSRVKDFDVLPHPSSDSTTQFFLATANSEGIVRVYALDFAKVSVGEIQASKKQKVEKAAQDADAKTEGMKTGAEGFSMMVGEHDTARRIMCLTTAEVDAGAVGIVADGSKDEKEESIDSDTGSSEDSEDEEDNIPEEEEEEWGGIQDS
ncbi:hypothetical protein ABW19_dt0208008 [Dactylella cylindrospora]|nr:hypothetical protein ABW19_dt0208008 [Dactylella cylindrospora]